MHAREARARAADAERHDPDLHEMAVGIEQRERAAGIALARVTTAFIEPRAELQLLVKAPRNGRIRARIIRATLWHRHNRDIDLAQRGGRASEGVAIPRDASISAGDGVRGVGIDPDEGSVLRRRAIKQNQGDIVRAIRARAVVPRVRVGGLYTQERPGCHGSTADGGGVPAHDAAMCGREGPARRDDGAGADEGAVLHEGDHMRAQRRVGDTTPHDARRDLARGLRGAQGHRHAARTGARARARARARREDGRQHERAGAQLPLEGVRKQAARAARVRVARAHGELVTAARERHRARGRAQRERAGQRRRGEAEGGGRGQV